MIALPIAFTAPDVPSIRSGAITQFRRPGSLLRTISAGDRLWLREPFHLLACYDGIAPGDAVNWHGATVAAFAADAPLPPDPSRGRKRFAREMPRKLSRMHLVVTAVRRERLQEITDGDARAEGARDRIDFVGRWDRLQSGGRTISGDAAKWADNPMVTVVSFRPVQEPLQ